MGHDHSHADGHTHGAAPSATTKRRLTIVMVLTGSYMLVEVVAGIFTHSLALLAEAAHMFTDVAAVALALFAIRVAERPPTPERSYGYHRAEILAALANGVLLISLCGFVFVEAIERLASPQEVHGKAMLLVATFGLVVNGIGILVLRAGAQDSLNVKAAYFEVLSDAISAVGVIIAGAVVWATGWSSADALVSAGISLFILPRTWVLLRDAVGVLLEGTPADVSPEAIRQTVSQVPGVTGAHDLHVWSLTTGVNAMSVHAALREGARHDDVRRAIADAVRGSHKVAHVTVQVEGEPCGDAGVHP